MINFEHSASPAPPAPAPKKFKFNFKHSASPAPPAPTPKKFKFKHSASLAPPAPAPKKYKFNFKHSASPAPAAPAPKKFKFNFKHSASPAPAKPTPKKFKFNFKHTKSPALPAESTNTAGISETCRLAGQQCARRLAAMFHDWSDNSAFVRKLSGHARNVCAKSHRLAKKAAPYVRANALSISIGAAAICVILLVAATMMGDITYYEYSYNGKVLGVVKSETEVYKTVRKPEAKKDIDEQAGAYVILDEDSDIAIKKVLKATPANVDDEEAIITNIATLNEVDVIGCAIAVDGKNIGTVKSEKAADELLQRIEDRWMEGKDPAAYQEIGFTGEVVRSTIQTEKLNIESVDEIFTRLVQTSFAAIGLKTIEEIHYEEAYDAAPVYFDKKNRYEDYTLELTPGAVGLRKVTAALVRVNGERTEKTPTSYEVIRPAASAYIIRGTKKLPPAIGNGTFIRPVRGGTVSSPFGRRWGRMHEGIDINVKYAPVYAANDGIIVYTGNKGDSYGNKIVIDHGDGLETLYGHLSASSVSVGDKVYKGQRIATSGNTGRSTGPHLHFEVCVDGTPRNPLDYM
ncbi:MAG: peptidoglycan DD-metalloendopeptidase family protein [Clostridiales Family XIII bacterium]|nr:peptidoglycan DD-metalloendopeptidase family protein [Clostridiales Family XIII bacterium]